MTFRVIPRLDIKPPNLVKGIHLEGVRKLGNPAVFAQRYYEQGADEIFYQDVVASLYGRNSIAPLVQEAAEHLFIPLTVGGGLREVGNIQAMLRHGADKVLLNTMAIQQPELIREAANIYGSQCIVVALEVMKSGPDSWEPLTESGRQHTGLDAEEWALKAVELGAGELLVTSIEAEGTKKGFDFAFAERLLQKVNVPVVLHGGAGSAADVVEVAKRGFSGAVIASALHYERTTIAEIKTHLDQANIAVRMNP